MKKKNTTVFKSNKNLDLRSESNDSQLQHISEEIKEMDEVIENPEIEEAKADFVEKVEAEATEIENQSSVALVMRF